MPHRALPALHGLLPKTQFFAHARKEKNGTHPEGKSHDSSRYSWFTGRARQQSPPHTIQLSCGRTVPSTRDLQSHIAGTWFSGT